MNKDLQSYVALYPGVIEPDICNRIIEEIELKEWMKHTYTDPVTLEAKSFNGNKELDVLYDEVSDSNHINETIQKCVNTYIESLNFGWWSKWSSHSVVRFNRYREGQLMSAHCDHIHSIFDGNSKGVPVVSIVGFLNNNFDGGEFIFWENGEVKGKQGDVLIFPSNFLYPHRVNLVKSGTRYSFITWGW